MRAILASLLDPTVMIDELGTIVAASDSVRRVFLYEPDELVGKNVKLLMGEPHHSQHDEYLAHYRATKETNILGRTREFEVVRRDGSMIRCDLSVARVEEDPEAPPLFVGSFRDVTERRLAEEAVRSSERRFRALFDRSFQFIGLLRTDGTLLEANETACESCGVRKEDVIGRAFWETPWWSHSAEVRRGLRDAVERCAAGEFVRMELTQRAREGTILDVDFAMTPVRDEAGTVVLLIPEGRDVSDLKAAQRTETAMLRALATIGESAAVLAHEIKNPITGVNLALRAVADRLGEDHKTVLADLVGRMKHLETLMRRTLSFARPIDPQWVDCDAGDLFAQVTQELSEPIARTGSEIRIEVEGDGKFRGDPHLLGEVLANLVANALEAKPGGGLVLLRAAAVGPGEVELSVEDDGPGIPPDRRASVFKPFVTTKAGGTGLGLAICKKIVEEHGGVLRVESSSFGGARMVLRLKRHS